MSQVLIKRFLGLFSDMPLDFSNRPVSNISNMVGCASANHNILTLGHLANSRPAARVKLYFTGIDHGLVSETKALFI
jgi:hypothetical protein